MTREKKPNLGDVAITCLVGLAILWGIAGLLLP